MKTNFLILIALFASLTASYCQNKQNKANTSGWEKYESNPVLGGSIGTIFDVCVVKTNEGSFRMYSSWYDGDGIALSESKDGLQWTAPATCLPNTGDGWDEFKNRPSVLIKDGVYHLWYSGQGSVHSWIGHATSTDGKNWKKNDAPVLLPDAPWEKVAVMSPHVIWDKQTGLFKMWYSGGGQVEADAIGYATSQDGIHWEKYTGNPVFTANNKNVWEQARVGGPQVIKREKDYLMFYIGYADTQHAQIGMARSKDGITNWERYEGNPVIQPGPGWDADAVYKPFAIPDSARKRWLLYYNGRRAWIEQIGVAVHKGMNLGF